MDDYEKHQDRMWEERNAPRCVSRGRPTGGEQRLLQRCDNAGPRPRSTTSMLTPKTEIESPGRAETIAALWRESGLVATVGEDAGTWNVYGELHQTPRMRLLPSWQNEERDDDRDVYDEPDTWGAA